MVLPGARARVAQLVEHATENRSVGGSTPSPGTTNSLKNNDFSSCELTVFNAVCNFGVIESDGQRDTLLKVEHRHQIQKKADRRDRRESEVKRHPRLPHA